MIVAFSCLTFDTVFTEVPLFLDRVLSTSCPQQNVVNGSLDFGTLSLTLWRSENLRSPPQKKWSTHDNRE